MANEAADRFTEDFNKLVKDLSNVYIEDWDEDYEPTRLELARVEAKYAEKEYLETRLKWLGQVLIERAYPDTEADIQEGLRQSAAGEVVDLGDFEQYADYDLEAEDA